MKINIIYFKYLPIFSKNELLMIQKTLLIQKLPLLIVNEQSFFVSYLLFLEFDYVLFQF